LYLVDRPFDNVHHNTCNIGHDGVDPFLAQLFVLQPNLPNMYGGSQQRSTSNPRAYAAPDMGAVGGDRREDAGQGVYDSGYPNYQQSGYAGMQNVNYQYGAQGMGWVCCLSCRRDTDRQDAGLLDQLSGQCLPPCVRR
jgi:hypothetical protein